jgi:hypothetical protein
MNHEPPFLSQDVHLKKSKNVPMKIEISFFYCKFGLVYVNT